MNYPTNFNQLKSYLQEGMKLTLIDCDPGGHKFLNVTRAIIKKQSNAVKLEGGSWLGLGSTGEKAGNFSFNGDTFTLTQPFIKLTYRIGE